MASRIIFILAIIFVATATPWASPPVALLLGVIFGLSFTHPFEAKSRKAAKYLLQLSVIGLGFGMNLLQVIAAGRSGFIYDRYAGWWPIEFKIDVDIQSKAVSGGDPQFAFGNLGQSHGNATISPSDNCDGRAIELCGSAL